MSVPVRNLYYLLCYAWDALEEGRVVDVSKEEFGGPPDLLARVLESGTVHLLKRGLDRGYVTEFEETSCPRGKFDVSATVKAGLATRPRVFCHVDSLSYDVPHNRILRTTIGRLTRCDSLDAGLRDRLFRVYRRLDGVREVALTPDVFGRVVLHRNNAFYGFLLQVCRFLYDNLLVDERTGTAKFRDFLRDDRAMARLFERFVRNFYRREQDRFRVRSERIEWQGVECLPADRAFLPVMRTDVSLESPSRKIVIDTKYYGSTLQARFGKETVHSGNLYQLYAYLRNLRLTESPERSVEGVLLYPTVGTSLDLAYVIQGQRLRVATVDLAAEWPSVHETLLKFLRPCPVRASPPLQEVW